eukprot:9476693-Pyramimonas_sp.AAC.1
MSCNTGMRIRRTSAVLHCSVNFALADWSGGKPWCRIGINTFSSCPRVLESLLSTEGYLGGGDGAASCTSAGRPVPV